MRPLAFVLAALLAFPAFAGDRSRSAPTGFVVAPDDDEDPIEKPSKNPDEEPAPAKKPKKKRESEAPAWNEQSTPRGLTIVDENAVAPTVIKAGDLESDRAGKPLLNPRKGIGVVQPVTPVGKSGSFTFKASASEVTTDDEDEEEAEDDDEAPARPLRPAAKPAVKPAATPKAPRAPSSMLIPTDDDDEPTPSSRGGHDDPFEESHAPTPAPQRATSTTVNLHDDDSAGSISAPPRSFLPAGKQIGGSGGAIKVEEVEVDYKQDSFIEVGGRRKAEPKSKPKPEPAKRVEPAPEPTYRAPPPEPEPLRPAEPPPAPPQKERPAPEPEPVRPTPEPEAAPEPPKPSPKADEPAPRHRSNRLLLGDDESEKAPESAPLPAPKPVETSRRPVVASPPETPAPVEKPAEKPADKPAEDPFEKLNRELRELEARPPPEQPAETKRTRPPEVKPEIPPEPELAVKPIETHDTTPDRDPSILGLSASLIAGAVIANDPVSGFRPDFAYGVGVMLNPSFAGPVALDLSLVRATRSDGTSFISVDSAFHHIAARVLYLKEQKNDVFFGFGPGLLLTANTATYNVNDGHATSLPASQLRIGVDGSVVAGIRFRPVEIRLDLRTLLRGGFRLDFLPTLSAGVAF